MSCPYANLFGAPNTGPHAYRIADIAVVDAGLTLLVAAIIAYFTKHSFAWTLFWLFLIGIFLHRLFCVRTTIDKILFP
jgi:type IV secretory pathway VirB2 component (pilin)